MIQLDSKLRPAEEVVFTSIDEGRTALLHLSRKYYFSLNPTGTHVWKGIQAGRTVAEIVESLQREYAVESDRAEKSVVRLVTELVEEGLVEVLG